jgi:hypothetical protein
MAQPSSRRVIIGIRTACAATAAQHHRGVPAGSVLGEPMVVYETRRRIAPAGLPTANGSIPPRNGALRPDRHGAAR